MEDATKPAIETPEEQDELTAAMSAAAAAKAVLGSLEGLRSATESCDKARAEIGEITQALNGLALPLQQLVESLKRLQPESMLERSHQQAEANLQLILEALQRNENNRSETAEKMARQLEVLITETRETHRENQVIIREMQLPPPTGKGEADSGTNGREAAAPTQLINLMQTHFNREEQDLKNIAAAISVIRTDLQQVASRKGILI